MSYGELLRTAFSITRRNRYLWFFGLFAGGGAGFNVPTNFNFGGTNGGTGDVENPFGQGVPSIDPAVIIGVVAFVLVIALVALALYLISQGALIDSVAAIDRGGERRFGTAWKAGARTFWRVLGWAVLWFVIAVGIVLVVGLPLAGVVFAVFSATEAIAVRIAVGVVAAVIAVLALLAIFVPLGIVAELSVRELVLREVRPVAALRAGYRMFRANVGTSLLVWLILLGVGLGAGIAVLIVLVIVGIVLFLPTIGLIIAELVAAAIVTGIVAAVIVLALFLVAFGALGTFTHAVWTLAYLRLGRPAVEPEV